MSELDRLRDMQEVWVRTGVRRERERVLGIVAQFAQCDECEAGGKADDCSPPLAQHIIKLIKGETDER
jgi:hypothetical protein